MRKTKTQTMCEILDEIFREATKKTKKKKKEYPKEVLFVACRVCTEPIDGELVDYAIPDFVLVAKDQKTGELKKRFS